MEFKSLDQINSNTEYSIYIKLAKKSPEYKALDTILKLIIQTYRINNKAIKESRKLGFPPPEIMEELNDASYKALKGFESFPKEFEKKIPLRKIYGGILQDTLKLSITDTDYGELVKLQSSWHKAHMLNAFVERNGDVFDLIDKVSSIVSFLILVQSIPRLLPKSIQKKLPMGIKDFFGLPTSMKDLKYMHPDIFKKGKK